MENLYKEYMLSPRLGSPRSQRKVLDLDFKTCFSLLQDESQWLKRLRAAYQTLEQQIEKGKQLRQKRFQLQNNRLKLKGGQQQNVLQLKKKIKEAQSQCLTKESQLREVKQEVISNAAQTRTTNKQITSLKLEIEEKEKRFKELKEVGEERKLNENQLEKLIDKTNMQIKEANIKKMTLKQELNRERISTLNMRSHKDIIEQIKKAEEYSQDMRSLLSKLVE